MKEPKDLEEAQRMVAAVRVQRDDLLDELERIAKAEDKKLVDARGRARRLVAEITENKA